MMQTWASNNKETWGEESRFSRIAFPVISLAFSHLSIGRMQKEMTFDLE